jgi:hypothetical protein
MYFFSCLTRGHHSEGDQRRWRKHSGHLYCSRYQEAGKRIGIFPGQGHPNGQGQVARACKFFIFLAITMWPIKSSKNY